jgi:hypothetical protein
MIGMRPTWELGAFEPGNPGTPKNETRAVMAANPAFHWNPGEQREADEGDEPGALRTGTLVYGLASTARPFRNERQPTAPLKL